MQKTREDFVGSTITQNVKYSDNAWQCYGSIDRKSVYTSESILDLILENIQYDRDKSVYTYKPRASAGSNSKIYPATLSHDIILINALAYQSTNTVSYSTIQNLQNFLSYALLITNPVYNSLAKKEVIKLIDLDVWSGITDKTLKDFAECFISDFTVPGEKQVVVNAGIDHFIKTLLGSFVSSDLKSSISRDTTLAAFAGSVISAGMKDKFESEFGLPLHDPKSVKLPFYPRNDSEDEYSSNIVNYFTRVLANVTLPGVVSNTVPRYYIESISDEFENKVSLTGTFLSGLGNGNTAEASSGVDWNTGNPEDSYLSRDEERVRVGMLALLSQNEDASEEERVLGGYGAYIPKVYLGELDSSSESLRYTDSFGIHLINPLDKTTIFREDDSKYSVYGSLLIGYNYVDALLTQRTFLGTVLSYLSSTNDSNMTSIFNTAQQGSALSELIANGANVRDLQQTLKSNYYEYCVRVFGNAVENSNQVYYSLNALAKIAKLGVNKEGDITGNNGEFKFIGELEGIGRWLQNETFLVKAPIYGDFVEPVNFEQDLHPNSKVVFQHLRLQKSSNRVSPYDDSKVEVPYISKTAPLINLSKEEKGFGKLASDALPGLGNLTNSVAGIKNKTSPAFFYDYNKGDEEDNLAVDDKSKTAGKYQQRVRSLEGGLAVEGEIESITIDEIWTALKLLFEASGHKSNKYNLPSFYGIKSSSVGVNVNKETIILNPKNKDNQDTYIDVLDWNPVTENVESFYGSETTPEKQYRGFEVNNYIPKVIDYKVNLFGRPDEDFKLDDKNYEFNTEHDDYDDLYNYMLPVLNQTILSFDNTTNEEWNAKKFSGNDTTWHTANDGVRSDQQKVAWNLIHSILDYDSAESLHNHYKKYLDNPKNLKTIERDLEAIRQNLQTFAEYVTTTSVLKGALDRQTNRGTLHTLHRNFFEFESTFLKDDSNYLRDDFNQGPIPTEEDVVKLDKKVVYKDGNFANRYDHDNFDAYTMDRSGLVKNTRALKACLKDKDGNITTEPLRAVANETFISEVYMGADGQWHSVHEYTILPIVKCEY